MLPKILFLLARNGYSTGIHDGITSLEAMCMSQQLTMQGS